MSLGVNKANRFAVSQAFERSEMAEPQIAIPEEEIASFCRRWKVSELALFGSVLRGDFSTGSDVDVLVSFAPDAGWSLFDLVTMQEELKAILGREVDLVDRFAIERSENYIRRQSILSSLEVVYAAR
jgi:predicted nucleotidyltransferase